MPLTWRNVNAPSFAPAIDGIRTASDLLGRATTAATGAVDTYTQAKSDAADRALLTRAQSIQDAESYKQALADGSLTQGLNQDASLNVLHGLDNRTDSLVDRAATEQLMDVREFDFNQSQNQAAHRAQAERALANIMPKSASSGDAAYYLNKLSTELSPEAFNQVVSGLGQRGFGNVFAPIVGVEGGILPGSNGAVNGARNNSPGMSASGGNSGLGSGNLNHQATAMSLQERLAQSSAQGLASQYPALLQDSRDKTQVAAALAGKGGIFEGTSTSFLEDQIDYIIAQSDGRITPALAGAMIGASKEEADNPIERLGRKAANLYTLDWGANRFTPDLANNSRIKDSALKEHIDNYLSGNLSKEAMGHQGIQQAQQEWGKAEAAYQRANAEYEAIAAQVQNRPGLAPSLERARAKLDKAKAARDGIQTAITQSPALVPVFDTTEQTAPAGSGIGTRLANTGAYLAEQALDVGKSAIDGTYRRNITDVASKALAKSLYSQEQAKYKMYREPEKYMPIEVLQMWLPYATGEERNRIEKVLTNK